MHTNVLQEDGSQQLRPVVCGVSFGAVSGADASDDEDDDMDGPNGAGGLNGSGAQSSHLKELQEEYAAPEVRTGALPTAAADMWSLGCIMTEVFRCGDIRAGAERTKSGAGRPHQKPFAVAGGLFRGWGVVAAARACRSWQTARTWRTCRRSCPT